MPPPKEGGLSSLGRGEIEEYLREILLGDSQADPQREPRQKGELEDFLSRYPFSQLTEWMYCDVVAKIGSDPVGQDMDSVYELLHRMVDGGRPETRLLAYKLGLKAIGRRFAEPALKDASEMVRDWAQETLT